MSRYGAVDWRRHRAVAQLVPSSGDYIGCRSTCLNKSKAKRRVAAVANGGGGKVPVASAARCR